MARAPKSKATATAAKAPSSAPARPAPAPTVVVYVERGDLGLRAEGVAWADRDAVAAGLLETLDRVLRAKPQALPTADTVPSGYAVHVPEPWEGGARRVPGFAR